jgi:arylsulfatase A-like enzyme
MLSVSPFAFDCSFSYRLRVVYLPLHMPKFNHSPGDDGGVPSEFEFMPQMLHRRFGFQCHHIGKWHLGFKKESWTPTHRGFLTSIGFYHWVRKGPRQAYGK